MSHADDIVQKITILSKIWTQLSKMSINIEKILEHLEIKTKKVLADSLEIEQQQRSAFYKALKWQRPFPKGVKEKTREAF